MRGPRTQGQLSCEQLIDRYGLTCRPARDLLVDYLRERQSSLDYASLHKLSYTLGRLFWRDLEIHHPGIESLHLLAAAAVHRAPARNTAPRPMKNGTSSLASERRKVSLGTCGRSYATPCIHDQRTAQGLLAEINRHGRIRHRLPVGVLGRGLPG